MTSERSEAAAAPEPNSKTPMIKQRRLQTFRRRDKILFFSLLLSFLKAEFPVGNVLGIFYFSLFYKVNIFIFSTVDLVNRLFLWLWIEKQNNWHLTKGKNHKTSIGRVVLKIKMFFLFFFFKDREDLGKFYDWKTEKTRVISLSEYYHYTK